MRVTEKLRLPHAAAAARLNQNYRGSLKVTNEERKKKKACHTVCVSQMRGVVCRDT